MGWERREIVESFGGGGFVILVLSLGIFKKFEDFFVFVVRKLLRF